MHLTGLWHCEFHKLLSYNTARSQVKYSTNEPINKAGMISGFGRVVNSLTSMLMSTFILEHPQLAHAKKVPS